MAELHRVKLSGDLEGDYVVLQHHAGGALRIAPAQPAGLPRLVALKKTCTACPSQWEGTLDDGRAIYVRYRHGELSVGIGSNIDEAVDNSRTDQALLADYAGNGLDGFMDIGELKVHLHGLLEFPDDLIVDGEQPPSAALEPRDDDPARLVGNRLSPGSMAAQVLEDRRNVPR